MGKIICIFFILFGIVPCQGQGIVGRKVPEFSGYMLDGNIINQTVLAHKLVLMNFMFIGCKGCMEELPQLSKINEMFQSAQFMVVSIIGNAIDDIKSYQGIGDTTKFFYAIGKELKYGRIKNLIIAECKNINKRAMFGEILTCTDNISKAFKINSYPTNLLIDKDGIIVKKYSNLLIEKDFEDLVSEIETRLK